VRRFPLHRVCPHGHIDDRVGRGGEFVGLIVDVIGEQIEG
jgi:hypothetical protein